MLAVPPSIQTVRIRGDAHGLYGVIDSSGLSVPIRDPSTVVLGVDMQRSELESPSLHMWLPPQNSLSRSWSGSTPSVSAFVSGAAPRSRGSAVLAKVSAITRTMGAKKRP